MTALTLRTIGIKDYAVLDDCHPVTKLGARPRLGAIGLMGKAVPGHEGCARNVTRSGFKPGFAVRLSTS